ncbi:MAG TPA: magnesium-translocating P-type ATPase [Devosia sp.]|nr:magnesium-translocating P-type ATPase [Devosia sp.]
MARPVAAAPHEGPSGPGAAHASITAGSGLGDVLRNLGTSPSGLSEAEAVDRLRRYGPNRLRTDDGVHPVALLFRQFRSPLVLILLAAAALSLALGETTEAIIVIVIVVASSGLGFYQEFRADSAIAELRRRINVSVRVQRDGTERTVPISHIVPGDLVMLTAGSLVPADAVLISADSLNADEAALTGESLPVEKRPAGDGPIGPENLVHMGTSIRSGDGVAIVIETGIRTEFGAIANAVARFEPETSFALGIRRFGLLMTQVMLVLVTVVLVGNLVLGRPVLDSLLFAAALAVGLTPELLPAIVSVTLAQGARQLAAKGVIVQRLVAIENLGSMDVLCTDKTGTLTEGVVSLACAVDPAGIASDAVLGWAAVNAGLQAAMPNPLDAAILNAAPGRQMPQRLSEVPYDFERRRLSLLVAAPAGPVLICKGATGSVLPLCSGVHAGTGVEPLSDPTRVEIEKRIDDWSGQGYRVLAVATRAMHGSESCTAADENHLTLAGFLLFSDRLKEGIERTVESIRKNGIRLKILTGDNRHAALHVAKAAGIATSRIVTGDELTGANDRRFVWLATHANVFAEVTPGQKERLVGALRRAGHTVGYLGDGINDAPALRTADIGVSVDSAVDAAKSAADVVLLRRDLDVLLDGIVAGRKAFGNTIKYIGITISANFGNMISMAVASIVLPFLPLLAMQILLNNALSDLPMLAISTDRVDAEVTARPRRWDFKALLRAMIGFGLVSSLFDGVTFAVLLLVFHAGASLFQTAWFVESLLTELAVVAVMRTRHGLFRSRPSTLLVVSSVAVAVATLVIPYLPFAPILDFHPLTVELMATILAIVAIYVLASELLKQQLSLLAPARKSPRSR